MQGSPKDDSPAGSMEPLFHQIFEVQHPVQGDKGPATRLIPSPIQKTSRDPDAKKYTPERNRKWNELYETNIEVDQLTTAADKKRIVEETLATVKVIDGTTVFSNVVQRKAAKVWKTSKSTTPRKKKSIKEADQTSRDPWTVEDLESNNPSNEQEEDPSS